MVTLCWMCGRMGTPGDGPGAACRACIRLAVTLVTDEPVGPSSHRAGIHRPQSGTRLPLTMTERTLVAFALQRVQGRVSDVVLAGCLPVLGLELAARSLAARRRSHRPVAVAPPG